MALKHSLNLKNCGDIRGNNFIPNDWNIDNIENIEK